jgi:hypothetical protein
MTGAYNALAAAINERVLRTPEPTPKQEKLMEEFADEMPVWAQLAFVQSENERMREELRQALARSAPEHPTVDDLRKLAQQSSGDQGLQITDEMVERAAEALWNEREFRDPTGDPPDDWCPPGHDVHQRPPNEPALWAEMVAAGKYEGDQADYRKDARAVLAAALTDSTDDEGEQW